MGHEGGAFSHLNYVRLSRPAHPLLLEAYHRLIACPPPMAARNPLLLPCSVQGVTALLAAAAAGHGPTARLLLQHGADPAARDAVQRRCSCSLPCFGIPCALCQAVLKELGSSTRRVGLTGVPRLAWIVACAPPYLGRATPWQERAHGSSTLQASHIDSSPHPGRLPCHVSHHQPRRTALHWAAYHSLEGLAQDVLREAAVEVDAEDAGR